MGDAKEEELSAAERLRREEAKWLAQMEQQAEMEAARQRVAEKEELRLMRKEEYQQCCKQDTFWGIDFKAYELDREEWERQQMQEEDDLAEDWRLEERRKNNEEAAAYARWQAEQHTLELERQHAETVAMATEEGIQTAVDRFWGVDTYTKQRRDAAEKRLREVEERRAREKAGKLRRLQEEWRKKGEEMQRIKKAEEARKNELVRQQYMRMFFSSTTSADVIGFRWPTFTEADDLVPPPDPAYDGMSVTTPAFSVLPTPGSATGSVAGFDMGVVYAPERAVSPVHVLHRLNPVRTAGKRHLNVAPASNHFELVPDLRPGGAPGVPPVDFKHPTMRQAERVQEARKKQAATRATRRGSMSATGKQWPVPAAEARSPNDVTLRGFVLAASQLLRHINNPDKMAKNAGKYQRTYCAMWKTSVLFFFDSQEDARAFFKQGSSTNTASGYIDLEGVVAVRERKGTPPPKPAKSGGKRKGSGASAGSGKEAGAGAGAGAGSDEAGAGGGTGDESKAKEGAASSTDGKEDDEEEEEPPMFHVLELVGLGQTWYLVPDPAAAEEKALDKLDECQAEYDNLANSIAGLEADAKAKEAASRAAEKKGPREGNYKLKIRAQTARAKVQSAKTGLVRAEETLEKAEIRADNAREGWFENWRNVISSAVAARNAEVHVLEGDEELAKPPNAVDPAKLKLDTVELIQAVTLSKLGPWSMPVNMMGKVEKLMASHKMRTAGLASGSPLAQLRAESAEPGKRTKKPGLERGRVYTVSEKFGFLRPEDLTGDKDIIFDTADVVGKVGIGDVVTYDAVRDERGMTKKDMRAVNVQRVEPEPYAGYDDLDTMPWQPTNAADLWCTESLQRARASDGDTRRRAKRGGGRGGRGSVGSRASKGGSVGGGSASGAGGGKPAPGARSNGRRRRRRPDVSPVRTSGRSGDGPESATRPTTPGGTALPRLPSSKGSHGKDSGGWADGRGAKSKRAARMRATSKKKRVNPAKAGGGGPALAPILQRGQQVA